MQLGKFGPWHLAFTEGTNYNEEFSSRAPALSRHVASASLMDLKVVSLT